MWVHLDDVSINLGTASHISPGPDGQLIISYPNSAPIVLDGEKSKSVRHALTKAPVFGEPLAIWNSWVTRHSGE
jgi:hypothetical protein